MNWKKATAISAAVPALLLGSGIAGIQTAAWADTTGNAGGLVSGGGVLAAMGFVSGFIQPNSTTTVTFIDYTGSAYGYVRNDYIGVVQGYSGSYGVSYPSPLPAISHNVAGMLSFGNTGGSLVYTTDDLGPLNGFNFSDLSSVTGGQQQGYGVWPCASRYSGLVASTYTGYGYDYPAYLRARIDAGSTTTTGGTAAGTIVNIVGGDTATALQAPTYINGKLTSKYLLLQATGGNGGTGTTTTGQGVTLAQEISLYRATARLRWTLSNTDSVAHSVSLRFAVNIRASLSDTGSPTSGQYGYNTGFYFQDPQRGVSNLVTLLAQVPDQLNVYGRRYEVDDTANTSNPPFAARHTFRGFSATPPTQVYVTNPAELDPALAGTFDPGILNPGTNYLPVLDNGIATASYFGPYTLAPGQSQDIITYYGNGTPSELLNDDFVTATEARESLAFDSAAALNSTVVGNRNATDTTVGVQFLTPNPVPVYGGIYNRVPSTPLDNVNLTNVTAALVLPQGLTLASGETSQKTLGSGTVLGDKNATTSWNVQPTGTNFGALPYQMTVSTNEFGSRTVTRVMNVPATPLHPVTANSFQMIGFPFQFDPVLSNNGDPSTVVNDLTAPTDEPVAFYRWVPDSTSLTGSAGSYQLATRLETGIAYFYRPNLNRTIFAKGVQPVAGQATTGTDFFANLTGTGAAPPTAGIAQVQVNLERGWNMISNPYLYEIPLNYLRFVTTDSNPSAASQTFQQAVDSGLVRGGVFYYNTTTKSYDFFDQINSPIEPWQGYWLFNNSRVALIYTLPTQRNSVILPTIDTVPTEPPTRSTKTTTKLVAAVPRAKVWGALESGRAFIQQPTTDNWKLQLVATKQNGASDKATIIGVSPTGRDVSTAAQNFPKPPPPVSDYVYVGIVRDDAKTRFAQDIKGPNNVKTWTVEVQSDTDGQVTLQWPNVARLPKRVVLTAKNEATGEAYSLSSRSSVVLPMKKGEATRLVFTAKNQSSQTLSLSNVQTVGGGRGVGSGMRIAFDLNQDAQISGVIKTLDGRVVAPLASGKAFAAGHGTLSWTGRAANGSALPAGGYQAVLTAKDDTTTVTRVIPIQTIR